MYDILAPPAVVQDFRPIKDWSDDIIDLFL